MGRTVVPWQKRRSEFNHDWLKNRYLPALAKWLNVLDQRIEDPQFESTFLSDVLPQWDSRGQEAANLARDAEEQISPSTLLAYPPLSGLPAAEKTWLETLTHRLWLERLPVRQWTLDAIEAVGEANVAYRRIQECLAESERRCTPEALRAHRSLFADFRERCRAVAKALEVFPSKVTVV